MNKQVIIVAVDGPSASGKSTVSRRTAQAVGFIYVESGALYRGITWKCVKEGVDVKDSQAVTNLLIRMNMELALKDNSVGYLIDGEDPGQEIRAEPVRERVADIAAQQSVRVYIVEKLRLMTKFGCRPGWGSAAGVVGCGDLRVAAGHPRPLAGRRKPNLISS